MTKILLSLGQPLQQVFYLDIPEDIILARLGGRMIHEASGRTYNENFNPPKVCGGLTTGGLDRRHHWRAFDPPARRRAGNCHPLTRGLREAAV